MFTLGILGLFIVNHGSAYDMILGIVYPALLFRIDDDSSNPVAQDLSFAKS